MARARKTPETEQTALYPNPRETADFYGHQDIEREVLESIRGGTLAHGLLLAGPQGSGKATFAFRLARYLLSGSQGQNDSLSTPSDSVVARQIADGITQDLIVIERPIDEKKGTPKAQIPAEDARKLSNFFAKTSSHGGYRVAIIDALDHMNRFGQNALLKTLEEPPPRSLILLISHNPGRVLPTIFSRCRRLNFHPLSEDELADFLNVKSQVHGGGGLDAHTLATVTLLSGGAPGRALTMLRDGKVLFLAKLMQCLKDWPHIEDSAVFDLADEVSKQGIEGLDLFQLLITQLVRAAAMQAATGNNQLALPGYEPQISKLAGGATAEAWSKLWQKLVDHISDGIALNADARQVVVEAMRLVKTP